MYTRHGLQHAAAWPHHVRRGLGWGCFSCRWSPPVEAVHRRIGAVGNPVFDGIGGHPHGLLDDRPLLRAECLEYELDRVDTYGWTAEADPKPGEVLGPDRVNDGFNAVVSAGTALGAQAHHAQLDVHVVGDDEQIGEVVHVVPAP